MKKFYCILLALLLCLTLCACQDENDNQSSSGKVENETVFESLPPLPENEYETLTDLDLYYIYGEIVGKLSPNALILEPDTPLMINTYGNTVYIISDQFEEWCVGDEIDVRFSTVQRPFDSSKHVRIIADEVYPLEFLDKKPIIYLYPEESTVCSVKVNIDGTLTCTYPEHGDKGWQSFTANPDGTLVFPDGKIYYALYWEGIQNTVWDFSQGFCVRGEDTAAFLEWALAEQGLSEREANEFIIYWLPLMKDNPYNVISFQTTAYTNGTALEISPAPDSLLRVFMAYYSSDSAVEIESQTFESFERQGFTVVEWGGSQINKK